MNAERFGNRPAPNTFCIVIPAYNAEAYLAQTLQPILSSTDVDRILVVDDGSSDRTSECAKALGVTCLRHDANRGKGSALMTGLLWARDNDWPWAVTMDADGQHAPADLASFYHAEVVERTAIVVGRRGLRGTPMPWHRRFSNYLTTRLIGLLAGKPVFDAQCGYRMYRVATVAEARYPREGRFEWESQVLVLACRNGFSIQPVDIATVYTDNGSHMRLALDTLRFLRMYGRLAWTR